MAKDKDKSRSSEQESKTTEQEQTTQQNTESESKDQNSARAKSEREGGDAGDKSNEEVTSDFLKVSEAAGEGENVQPRENVDTNDDPDTAPVAEYELPDDYDPANDPLVPSSDVAQTIRTELQGTGESNTLKALHAALKATESDDQ